MSALPGSVVGAAELILSFDAELISITLLSLYVSLLGVFFASILALPFAVLLGMKTKFPGRRFVINVINTFMGLPPVAVGLFLFILFSRQGALGGTGLLFTPEIMAIAQFIIALPIIAGVTLSAFEAVERDVIDLILSLGGNRNQRIRLTLFEMRFGILTAIMAGLGRALSEVGAVIIVGGNIRHHTRLLTTSIVLETSRGEFELALALGIILLCMAFVVNYAITILGEGRRRE